MPAPKLDPTYEALRAQRAQEWAAAQVVAGALLRDLHEKIAAMPDVRDAPARDVEWSSRMIQCSACAWAYFFVTRWVTVNGLRHRAELECANCQRVDTWDWATKAWMRPDGA
jgi:hypothetical protein